MIFPVYHHVGWLRVQSPRFVFPFRVSMQVQAACESRARQLANLALRKDLLSPGGHRWDRHLSDVRGCVFLRTVEKSGEIMEKQLIQCLVINKRNILQIWTSWELNVNGLTMLVFVRGIIQIARYKPGWWIAMIIDNLNPSRLLPIGSMYAIYGNI